MGDIINSKMNAEMDESAERLKLAERLRAAREYLGFTQEQVAQYLGVNRSALSNMESGQRRVEAVELTRLAKLYQMPVSHFIGARGEASDELPADIEHLARKASGLTKQDRQELSRFVDFLRSRAQSGEES